MVMLLTTKLSLLHEASLTDLIRTDPFPFDRPHAIAPFLRIVSCKMTVFDQTTACMVAKKVDDLELITSQSYV